MNQPSVSEQGACLSSAMLRYADGDQTCFSAIYRSMAPRLMAFFVRRTRDSALSEDLVQQTFLRVHRARHSYVPGADLGPWFFAIARRLLIDSKRRAKASPARPNEREEESKLAELAPQAGADEILYSKQLGYELLHQLRRVPEPHRVAFELVKLEGLSHADVAATLGTTCSAIKVRVHRVCRMLAVDMHRQKFRPENYRQSLRITR